jgi:probable phosphoglycerate mutase
VLSEKGRVEADATGAYLKTIGLGKFDRVISSTLPRTVETAERVMKVLGQAGEPTEVKALREISIGSPQGYPGHSNIGLARGDSGHDASPRQW